MDDEGSFPGGEEVGVKNLTIPSNKPSWRAQGQFYLYSTGDSIFLLNDDNGIMWWQVS
jgi:hypothetical protein